MRFHGQNSLYSMHSVKMKQNFFGISDNIETFQDMHSSRLSLVHHDMSDKQNMLYNVINYHRGSWNSRRTFLEVFRTK